MKNIYTEEIERTIHQRKRLPRELEAKMNKNVFRNLVLAACIMLYLILLNVGFFKLDKEIYIKDTAIYSIASLAMTIILFEKAFKTEKGFYAINGIEVLTVAIFTYFIPYMYFHTSAVERKLLMLLPLAYVIYYTGKGIVICLRTNAIQRSDVKEIIKEETKQDETISIDKDKEAEVRAKIIEEIKEKEKMKMAMENEIQKERTLKKENVKKEKKVKVVEEKPKTVRRKKVVDENEQEKKTTPVRKRTTKTATSPEEKKTTKTRTRKKKVEE